MAMNQDAAIMGKMQGQGKGSAGPDEKKVPKTFEGWIQEMAPAIKEALPSSFQVERFTRMILTSYKASPDLRHCTMKSVLGAAVQAAQLGLMVGILDQAYIIPFDNYKGKELGVVKEAQLVIGYKGYMELGQRTGTISHIDPGLVYPGDIFDFEYGSNEFIKHKPMGIETDITKPSHYYVIAHLTNGNKKFLVRTYQQIIRHAKQHTSMFKADGSLNPKSNWNKNFDPMAIKTVIRELFKTMPLTTEVMLAISADGTIKNAEQDRLSKNMAEEVIDITNYDYNAPDEPQPPRPEPGAAHEQEPQPPQQQQRQQPAVDNEF